MSTKQRPRKKTPARPATTLVHAAAEPAPVSVRELLPTPAARATYGQPDAAAGESPGARTPQSAKAPPAPREAPDSEAAAPASAAARGAALSAEQRRRRIAQLAYQRALRLGLGRTDPFHDWLMAEREVDAGLAAGAC